MVETLLLAGLNSGVIASAGTAVAIGQGVSLIGTGLTALSAFGSIMGGQQDAAVYKAQARQSEMSAKTEELKGREQADRIRRSLQATLASQNAAFGARGISLNSGTPVNIGNVSRSEASRDIENAQFNSNMSAAQERAQGSQYRIMGRAARTSGYMQAASTLGRRSLING